MSTTNTLIIGIGNPNRRDDGVGFFVIDQLQNSGLNDVSLMKMNSDGYALMEAWKDRKWVIIVDAAVSGRPAGTVIHLDALDEEIPRNLTPVSTHSINLAETITLARTLDQLPRHLVVFAIEAGNLDHGTELSLEVQDSGIKVAREIGILIKANSG